MNRTIKDATVKRYFYDTHDQLRTHLRDFVDAYNFARRLKTLKGLTPYEFICNAWASQPQRFKISPLQQMPGLNSSLACAVFFARDRVAGEEAADRAVAEDEALALKRAAQFLDRNIRRRLQNGEDRVLVRLDPARPAIAARWPSGSLALLAFERPPTAHARRADLR